MKLTDTEKREIVKLIELDKPIPDKYRFMLFDDKREVELVWNGKTNEVTNIVLPFQVIEQVDEPRSEKNTKMQSSIFDMFDSRGRQQKGWTNKLIWGDNKLILSSLKNGPIREEIEKAGGIKLIYIDPPFSAGLDYSIDVHIGNDQFNKKLTALEEFAYRNTWGNGGNTFIQMIYERVVLMKDLLSADGIFVLRIDHHWGHYIKTILDEIFGKEYFQSEVLVNRVKKAVTNQGKLSLPTATDSFYIYFKSFDAKFKHISTLMEEERTGYWRRTDDSAGERKPRERKLFGKVFNPPPGKHFKFSQQTMERMIEDNRLRYNEKLDRLEYFVLPTNLKILDTNWTDIPGYSFTTGYPTENSEQVLERTIDITTNENDIVADFFCGSGTTLAVAEKLGRKWIGTDLGKFAIHTTRKRMIGIQRKLKADGKDFRAFEILNLGKYERAHYIGVNMNLREEERQKQLEQRETDFIALILKAYKAESVDNFKCFHGKKAGRVVSVGPVNLPVTRLFVEEIILECREKRISRVDILAFEFEMGLFPNIQEEAKSKGIDLVLKYIPREVFDKRAIEKNQVVFHDVSYIEIKPHAKKGEIAVELTDFSVYYSQDSVDNATSSLGEGKSKIVVEGGKIIKLSKDKNGIVTREILTKKWTDWIDYWSVDFDYESKREIVREQNPVTGEMEEKWTGDYIFENEWQSFRTKKDRSLELITPFHECKPGRYKVAIKVVDIFGNDTMKIVDVMVGK